MASGVLVGALKWLVLPAAMAAVGYFVIGPKIGGNAYLGSRAATAKEAILPKSVPDSPPEDAEQGKFSKVKIDVNVTPDDRSKPDSKTEKKKPKYFSPDAGKSYDEIPEQAPKPGGDELPVTPDATPPAGTGDNGWH